ncbi:hypothetical protein B0H34DRAFT_670636 [Crassisporium funariophilum]|nr:hypothetical protein B0H34DRAFT_670636 [Crassisporium funariophilum]
MLKERKQAEILESTVNHAWCLLMYKENQKIDPHSNPDHIQLGCTSKYHPAPSNPPSQRPSGDGSTEATRRAKQTKKSRAVNSCAALSKYCWPFVMGYLQSVSVIVCVCKESRVNHACMDSRKWAKLEIGAKAPQRSIPPPSECERALSVEPRSRPTATTVAVILAYSSWVVRVQLGKKESIAIGGSDPFASDGLPLTRALKVK